jgi:hypothetical protein
LYLAWLSAYSAGERDEGVFSDEDEAEPPVPAGLGTLTAAQRALAGFLRLDGDLLEAAAQASPALPEAEDDSRALASYLAKLPVSDKHRLLMLVAEDQAARAGWNCCAAPRRTR